MLRYAKRYVPLSTVKTMYGSIVEPYLRYWCTVWGCCTETDLKRLQILQNRPAHILTNSAEVCTEVHMEVWKYTEVCTEVCTEPCTEV